MFFFDYTDPNEFRITYKSDEKSSSEEVSDEDVKELREVMEKMEKWGYDKIEVKNDGFS